ncbi:IS110 family transposase [Streptomyces sp. cg36]|uniref:IS110 family transposase n=1 Tax=Streptomyces sp. cg36 TaxID=3238798 RepID=UPI0034E1E0B4
MSDETGIDVYLGLDVGKGDHHAAAVNQAGKKVFDKPLPNSEPKLQELFDKLKAKHGTVLAVVDQPASIGALPLAVARDAGCQVAYLPGLTMRRIADLYPGEAKTDARDAFIIADAARAMPHTLRTIDLADETVAELAMIVGFDDDLAGESTRIANRLRGLLTQIHPSLERVLGPRIQHPAVLRLLDQFGSPAQIRKAGRRRLVTLIRPKAPRMAERLVEDIFTALDEQTVVVPGTDAAALIVPSLASSLQSVLEQRKLLAARIEELLEAHPLSQVLISMPGIGIRTAARILIDVGDASGFATAGHLAAYAGLAPVTRNSGTSIRGEHPSRRGNKQLKRAFYLAAFASLSQPESRAYYDRKRREGKHHIPALIALARRRIDVLFAMLRDGTFYQPPTPATA